MTRQAVLAVALVAASWGGAHAQAPGGPPPPVTVSTPVQKEVTEYLEYTGQFAATEYVEIRARVSGYLTELHFKDGQIVRKGDLLLVIDPRPFEVELQQATAQRDTAAANVEYTTRDVSRAAQLRRTEAIASSTLDQRVQAMKTAVASLSTANAAIRQAQLDLEFSHIVSPVTGRISNHQVSVGNLVVGSTTSTNQTLLTTIVSLDPVLFYFDMSESDFLAYQRAVRTGQVGSPREGGTVVDIRLDDERDWSRKGSIDFVDNQIDRASGTIRVRATFPNPDFVITPGQFGRLRLPISASHMALLVPDASVTTDQARKLVMTVSADGTVVPKVVETGPLYEGLRVIRSGLTVEDRVVIDGLLRARPGAKVAAQPGAIPRGSGS